MHRGRLGNKFDVRRQVELFYLGAIRFLAELHHAIFDFFWASAEVDELKLLHVRHHASVSERIEDFQQVIFGQLESKEDKKDNGSKGKEIEKDEDEDGINKLLYINNIK